MVKPRENRVPIMMSDEELKSVDDWRFANRIATRSDALRRLAQIGLRVSREIPNLIKQNNGVTRGIELIIKNTKAKLGNEISLSNPDLDTLFELVLAMFKDADQALLDQINATDDLFDLLSEIAPLANAKDVPDIAEALKTANERRAEVEAGERVLKQIWAQGESKKAGGKK